MIGVLAVDKPAGPTSHDVVAIARRALAVRRIGHTGTLDPFATGLLLLCIGTATRLAEYLSGLDKRYEATARLGVRTDTLDATGDVVSTSDAWETLDEAAVRAAFEGQRGPQLQRPPAFSAKRIGGRRAYDLARAGSALEPEAAGVVIHELDVLEVGRPDVRFRTRCSSGTYVRAIARDAGDALGVGAHLTALRRTAVGSFHVDGALTLARLGDPAAVAAALVSPLDALAHLPVVRLDEGEAERVRMGQALAGADRATAGMVALAEDGHLVAVAESDGRALRPRKVLG